MLLQMDECGLAMYKLTVERESTFSLFTSKTRLDGSFLPVTAAVKALYLEGRILPPSVFKMEAK